MGCAQLETYWEDRHLDLERERFITTVLLPMQDVFRLRLDFGIVCLLAQAEDHRATPFRLQRHEEDV